jgi:hypothetical protein
MNGKEESPTDGKTSGPIQNNAMVSKPNGLIGDVSSHAFSHHSLFFGTYLYNQQGYQDTPDYTVSGAWIQKLGAQLSLLTAGVRILIQTQTLLPAA